MDYQPIVTISVTAYNSSRYIRETLESIKAQTYKNIILQIADDCSIAFQLHFSFQNGLTRQRYIVVDPQIALYGDVRIHDHVLSRGCSAIKPAVVASIGDHFDLRDRYIACVVIRVVRMDAHPV